MLDVKMQRFLKQSYRRGLGEIHRRSTESMRRFLVPARTLDLPVKFKDIHLEGARIRHFSPNKQSQTLQGVVYLPANGFFIDRLGLNDEFCYYLCNRLNMQVYAIYHRLVPEFPFPHYIEDCYHAVKHVYSQPFRFNRQEKTMFLWAESSGATIGLSLAHLFKQQNLDIFKKLTIFYPMTDLATPYPSKTQFGHGYAMDAPFIHWMSERMFNKPQDKAHVLASPALWPELQGLPPMHLSIAGYDYFKDEGLAYANRFCEHNHAQITQYNSMIHGFLRFFPKHPVTLKAFEKACKVIEA